MVNAVVRTIITVNGRIKGVLSIGINCPIHSYSSLLEFLRCSFVLYIYVTKYTSPIVISFISFGVVWTFLLICKCDIDITYIPVVGIKCSPWVRARFSVHFLDIGLACVMHTQLTRSSVNASYDCPLSNVDSSLYVCG